MKLVLGFKPSYKKNRRTSIGGSFGPFVSGVASALMGQAIYWTKIVSAFTYYIFVICHLYGWLGLLTKKTKKITKYGENDNI